MSGYIVYWEHGGHTTTRFVDAIYPDEAVEISRNDPTLEGAKFVGVQSLPAKRRICMNTLAVAVMEDEKRKGRKSIARKLTC